MRKLFVFTLSILTTILLGSCGSVSTPMLDLDYSDFESNILSNYIESEERLNERYVLYYYESDSIQSESIKKEILNFFHNFRLMPFYLLDKTTTQGSSSLEPDHSIYIIADGEIIESYDQSNIGAFIDNYTNFDEYTLDYDYFKTQHIETYQEALDVDSDAYILYFYLENCPHCMNAKQDVLHWALQRDVRDIYFINGAVISNDGNPPTELIILNSGTPILVIMSNGKFADEFYSGSAPVLEYIDDLGLDVITTDNKRD